MCPVTRFFAVETNLSFCCDLESFDKKKCDQLHVFSLWRLTWVFDGTWKNFHKKSVPSHRFLRCADYLKFLMGIGIIFTKKCAQSHVSSLWRLTWVFDATWKVSTKKCDQLHGFSQCRLSQVFDGFWKNFHKKSVPSYTFCSLWRLTWVFDGTWKNFHKKVCSVICFLSVETNLSFWWDLEKFPQKSVPSHTFLRCGDYLKFCFWWDSEKFSQKSVLSHMFLVCGD